MPHTQSQQVDLSFQPFECRGRLSLGGARQSSCLSSEGARANGQGVSLHHSGEGDMSVYREW